MQIKKPDDHPDVRRHNQTAYAKLIGPNRRDSNVAQREKDRMRRILAGEDIESKEESLRKLKLHMRYGA